jgi:hypothetical protein
MHRLNPAEAPYEIFSTRNPLMSSMAQLADQTRNQRRLVSRDNPWLEWQAMVSDSMIAALDGWRKLRDYSLEQTFLLVYSSPLLQALVGMRGTDDPPRRRPGLEAERVAFVQSQITKLKARLANGGAREAAIRALVFIGLAGPGADERAFNDLRRIRLEYGGMTLQDFKQTLREQFFALLLDRDGALAAIPKMLPAEADGRREALKLIRRVVSATGKATGERAKRLARIEKLFAAVESAEDEAAELSLGNGTWEVTHN